MDPARLLGQTTTKPVNAFPDAANQPFWAGECEASWTRACSLQGSNPPHVRNQLKTDVPFSKEEARTLPGREPGRGPALETLAGDLPSAPGAWSQSLGRRPCYDWHPQRWKRKPTMAGHPVPVWTTGWEHLSEESRTPSTHNPTAFIQHRSLGSKFSARCDFQNAQKEHGISTDRILHGI